MPWEKIVRKPHRCVKPISCLAMLAGAAAGSIWKCDDCGARWQLTHSGGWNRLA